MRRSTEVAHAHINVWPIGHGQLIVVEGALDVRSAGALLGAFDAAVHDDSSAVVVDLDGTTMLDAFGRAALRRAGRQVARLHKTVLVVAAADTRERLGDVGRLLNADRLVSSRRIAVAAAIASSVA